MYDKQTANMTPLTSQSHSHSHFHSLPLPPPMQSSAQLCPTSSPYACGTACVCICAIHSYACHFCQRLVSSVAITPSYISSLHIYILPLPLYSMIPYWHDYILYCTVLYYAALCYAILYAALCCAMLWCAIFYHILDFRFATVFSSAVFSHLISPLCSMLF
jgi:hypothetical protein